MNLHYPVFKVSTERTLFCIYVFLFSVLRSFSRKKNPPLLYMSTKAILSQYIYIWCVCLIAIHGTYCKLCLLTLNAGLVHWFAEKTSLGANVLIEDWHKQFKCGRNLILILMYFHTYRSRYEVGLECSVFMFFSWIGSNVMLQVIKLLGLLIAQWK